MWFDLNTIMQIITLITAVCGVLDIVVLRPLKSAIIDLRDMIAEIRAKTEDDRRERHMIEVKLAKVEDSARSAHHRIDSLEQRG